MNHQKLSYVLKLFRGVLIFFGLPVLFFLVAGSSNWWQGWVTIGVAYTASIVSRALLTKFNPDLVKERVNYANKSDAKNWDKLLMPLVAMILPALFFITAALDRRFHWSGAMPIGLFFMALFIALAGYSFSTWAMLENRFFSAVVRIQSDRGHRVVDSGPYRIVRHPGYLSGVVVGLMYPLLVGSWWSYIPMGFMAAFYIVRTALEDNTLTVELPGYAEYKQRTRYRLIPGIW